MTEHTATPAKPLLEVTNLRKVFHTGGREVTAVDDVSFTLLQGHTLGLVGESGSGKSTTGLCVLGLESITSGKVVFDGVDLSTLKHRERQRMRRRMQMIFQDPYASLDPRFSVLEAVEEPLVVHRIGSRSERRKKAAELLDLVGISTKNHNKRPRDFSGGQRQRVGIARALALRPELIVCDEPVSALDVSIQAQILNLLKDLQDEFGLSYLFISHDLGVVCTMCDEVCVMRLGKLVEEGPAEQVLQNPQSEYTQKLRAAVPTI